MTKFKTIYILLFPLTFFAQADIINTSLTNPHQHLLYIGVDNTIEILGLDNNANLKLTSSTGKIVEYPYNKEPNIFYVRVDYKQADTLRLYQNDDLLLTRHYETKTIGDPIPQLGYLNDTTATVQKILANPRLNIIIPDCYYKHGFRVISFKVSFLQSASSRDYGTTLKTFEKNYGSQLTKDQIEMIKYLKKGKKIAFTEISASCSDCSLRRLQPLTITIK